MNKRIPGICPATLISGLITLVVLSLPFQLHAQDAQNPLTNADILKMTESGLAEDTIILVIQKSSNSFDTSAGALIELKKAGVSNAVLNAMLSKPHGSPADSTAAPTAQEDCSKTLDFALAVIGTPELLNNIHGIRIAGQNLINRANSSASAQVEHVTLYTGSVYILAQPSSGPSTKAVVTPEFNYLTTGKLTTSVPRDTLQELVLGLKLDPIYVSQHRKEYRCVAEGSEQIAAVATSRLRLEASGAQGYWNVDPTSGRIFRSTVKIEDNDEVTDYSDWRVVEGVSLAFKRHFSKPGQTSDVTIGQVEINPTADTSLFQRPAGQISSSITFKVLQEESVPYVVQTNGGISTSCNISGSTATTMSLSTYGNTAYGTATSTPNLRMNCQSTDTTIRWTHVLNAMLVEASDGNAYIIGCDRAWRWSKCQPLKAGDTFIAERTDKGFRVQSMSTKSKEQEATYSVLQSKSLR